MKEIAEGFKKQCTCLGENTRKYITFTVPIEKEVTRLIKTEMKLQKIYITCNNSLAITVTIYGTLIIKSC